LQLFLHPIEMVAAERMKKQFVGMTRNPDPAELALQAKHLSGVAKIWEMELALFGEKIKRVEVDGQVEFQASPFDWMSFSSIYVQAIVEEEFVAMVDRHFKKSNLPETRNDIAMSRLRKEVL
jgi:hypothetical protein